MKKNLLKKISLLVLVLCFSVAAFACGRDDESQDTLIFDIKEMIKENDTEKENKDVSIETTYPLVIKPEEVDYIYCCMEAEDIFMILDYYGWGYYNYFGEKIGEDSYTRAYPFTKEGVAVVYKDGKYGFIDINGEPVGDFIYDDLAPYSEGLAYFAKGEEYGFMNSDGSVAFYLDCDSVSSFSEGKAYFSIDGKYGYIDTTGNCVIPAEYSDADYFKNGLALVTVDGYKGAINDKGEVVIPLKYGVLVRKTGYIYAIEGERYDYFDLNGKTISEDEAMKLEEKSDNAKESSFEVKMEDSMFKVFDELGEEVLSTPYDYALNRIYQDNVNYVLNGDTIVLLENDVEKDMSEIILKHAVTPRKKLYFNAVIQMNEETDYAPEMFSVKTKFYDIDHSGEPILYYMRDAVARDTFPMSDSAFFVMDGNEVKTLLRGNECGGSMRGDYICFWKSMETGELVLGKNGATGGFGGIAVYSSTYEYQNKNVTEVLYFHLVEQTINNYDSEDLQSNAHLFYDEEGNTLNAETIMDAGYVTEYTLNDVRVTAEEYADAAKYKYFSLY